MERSSVTTKGQTHVDVFLRGKECYPLRIFDRQFVAKTMDLLVCFPDLWLSSNSPCQGAALDTNGSVIACNLTV